MNRLGQIAPCPAKDSNFFCTEVNKNVKVAEYAIKGAVPTLAQAIEKDIKNGNRNYPFQEVTYCSIGNPQQFNQKPLTFPREVLSCVVCPDLIENESVNIDARKRARKILDEIGSAGSYSTSLGIHSIREHVAEFIAREDNVPPPSVDDIFLCEGASQGVHVLFNTLIGSKDDSVMIPIPLYPLFSAAINLNGGCITPYYMDEDNGWQLSVEKMEKALDESEKEGKNVKVLVIINPGNPTGSILSAQSIEKVIQFAVKNRLVLIADEVYRENIYKEGKKFVSFRSVLETMSQEIRNNCELASLNSTSKGLYGESGFRGGYLYTHNFNPEVIKQIIKLKSMNLCSNVPGQIMVDCLANPPVGEDVTIQTKEKYLSERQTLLDSFKRRAKAVTKFLNEMDNIKAKEIEGALFSFPQIRFSKKAMEAAEKQQMEVDLFYCLEVLKNTGIVIVPGSGFKQQPGTYHFRITILVLPQKKLETKMEILKKYNNQFHAKYADDE